MICVIVVFVLWSSRNTKQIGSKCSFKKINRITHPYLMVREHVTIDILNLSCGWKAKTILLHITLKLEGLRDQGGVWVEGKPTWVLHNMWWILFHGLLGFVCSLPWRGGSNTKPREHAISKSHNPLFATLIIPISAWYYSKLRNASIGPISTNKSSTTYLHII